ncbi:MAG: siroheme synthase CysG [Pseudomonadota bacterium]
MRHFPVYLDTRARRIVVCGGGECAVAKLRLLLKTEGDIHVFAADAGDQVRAWADEGRVTLTERPATANDITDAILLYAAHDDDARDAEVRALGWATGVPTLFVDNLEESDFITPAIVDRAPVTVAIGTEGSAPVLARKIKADIEEQLPESLGALTALGRDFRPHAEHLPKGRARRDFWSEFYFDYGPKTFAYGPEAVKDALHAAVTRFEIRAARDGHVHFVSAGPGDPELLTLKARKILHEADVVIHDGLVPAPILELARREAEVISVAKSGFGPSWKQADINALLVDHGAGAQVVRLKSGDAGIFGRLDEETEALQTAGIAYSVVPGVTAASAAAADLGVSLTRRNRNSGLQILTGRDLEGFADHDWRGLAQPGAVAAIYMFRAAAHFITGRLLMQGADAATPATIVFNASRPDQEVVTTTLADLPGVFGDTNRAAILLLGIAAPETAARANPAAQTHTPMLPTLAAQHV